ncbi:hypothetical protein G6F31_011782 [Rhizopus arrhizus]|nr:hypothetical protein G6F31_011782 [Rhizopus arrhizus]
MAPGPHHLVLRALRAGWPCRRVGARSWLGLPVQQLLQEHRPGPCAATAWLALAPLAAAGTRLPPAGGCAGAGTPRCRRPRPAGAAAPAAGPAARATAPGTAAHRHQACLLVQPAAAAVPRGSAACHRHRQRTGLGRIARTHRHRRRRRLAPPRRLRLRQRIASAPRAAARPCPGRAPAQQRRVPGLHRGGRLPRAALVAQRRLGAARSSGLAAPAVLGRCPAARIHPGRLARTGPARAGLSPQLLRGRRLRPLGRCTPAQRVRMGSRCCITPGERPFRR